MSTCNNARIVLACRATAKFNERQHIRISSALEQRDPIDMMLAAFEVSVLPLTTMPLHGLQATWQGEDFVKHKAHGHGRCSLLDGQLDPKRDTCQLTFIPSIT